MSGVEVPIFMIFAFDKILPYIEISLLMLCIYKNRYRFSTGREQVVSENWTRETPAHLCWWIHCSTPLLAVQDRGSHVQRHPSVLQCYKKILQNFSSPVPDNGECKLQPTGPVVRRAPLCRQGWCTVLPLRGAKGLPRTGIHFTCHGTTLHWKFCRENFHFIVILCQRSFNMANILKGTVTFWSCIHRNLIYSWENE